MLPTVLLMGPTATGKTGLAVELARRLGGEIISVDSAQVYRGMDIGTAKPDATERGGIPHHLLDVVDPAESYSAARFRADAMRLVGDIRGRGRVPLLAGGTMLYFHALLTGLSRLPPAEPAFRENVLEEARRDGWAAIHSRLARLDPESAERLHPNDSQRILRALEIIELTGLRVAEAQGARDGGELAGPVVQLGLWIEDRVVLHRRIAERFHAMMAAGFVDEVRRLYQRGDLRADLPSMRAVGYRQIWAHLDGAWDLETAVDRGIAATRRLAKRQCTWLRSMPDARLLDAGAGALAAQAEAAVLAVAT